MSWIGQMILALWNRLFSIPIPLHILPEFQIDITFGQLFIGTFCIIILGSFIFLRRR